MKNSEFMELNAQELESVDGGIWWIVAGALVFLAIDYFQDGKIDGKISLN